MEVCTIGTHPAHAQLSKSPLGQGPLLRNLRLTCARVSAYPAARESARHKQASSSPSARREECQVRDYSTRDYSTPLEAPRKVAHASLLYPFYSPLPYSLLSSIPLPPLDSPRSPPPSAERAPRRAPPPASLYHRVHALSSHLRPQNHENTVSRPICEVKHGIV